MRKLTKKQQAIKRAIIFMFMVLSVLVIVTGIILFILGYRLDSMNGRLEQGALVQFDSRPNGANVTIDGTPTGSQTATKRSVVAGVHDFLVEKDGYRPWTKSLNLQAGTLTWLDYIRMVPKDLAKQTVRSYKEIAAVKAAPDMQMILVQPAANAPSFELIDIRSKDVKSTNITLPAESYSDATTEGVTHTFELTNWDESGRHILVKHSFKDTSEWIVMDTEDVDTSVNVTRLLGVQLQDIQFAGTSGNILYGLTNGDIRRLDLSSATLSRVLVSKASSFTMYKNNTLTFVGENPENAAEKVVGFYRDGDESPYILQTFSDVNAKLAVATVRYHTSDYIAYAENAKVTVLQGQYPNADQSRDSTLNVVAELTLPSAIDRLSFSPEGDYVLAQAGVTIQSYEVEHLRQNTATIDTSEQTPHLMQWLDKAYVWAVYDGHLSIREFDGTNVNVIMPMEPGFDATLSQNGKYIYGLNKTDGTYRLERVTMILE
jgi:hypothetical protein